MEERKRQVAAAKKIRGEVADELLATAPALEKAIDRAGAYLHALEIRWGDDVAQGALKEIRKIEDPADKERLLSQLDYAIDDRLRKLIKSTEN